MRSITGVEIVRKFRRRNSHSSRTRRPTSFHAFRSSAARTCFATALIFSRFCATRRSPSICRLKTSQLLIPDCRGLPGVAKHQATLEFVQVAAERLASFASRGEGNRSGAAECWRVMILSACRHAYDDGLNVATDVNPVFPAQSRVRQPVECSAKLPRPWRTIRRFPRLRELRNQSSA